MNELVVQNSKGNDVTTSLIVAQVFGKRNSDVLRDIRNLSCSDSFNERNFAFMVEMKELPQGGAQKTEYCEMTKDGFSFLVMGYTGEKAGQFKERFINEFNKREQLLKNEDYILARSQEILKNRVKLMEAKVAQLEEENELQSRQLKESAPKVEYFDKALSSVGTYTATQIAKEFGWGAETLNRKLKERGIHYKQNGQWILYAQYATKGYTKSVTRTFTRSDGSTGSQLQTVWTEKGREFIYHLLTPNQQAI
ncbi:MAG: hypothetical protein HDQ88_05375 [Clostridia bacterium]|nr:hypothetical protein [Clostridia bacterium]